MSARPYFKFFPENWRGDPALRMCSIGARGLWVEMLCLMHEAEPYGHLLIKGLPVNPKQLASLFGAGLRETVNALAELESCGVFSKTESGTIYSRRMVRDAHKASIGKTEVEKKWGGASDGQTRSTRLAEARKKGTHTKQEWECLAVALGERCLICGSGDIVRDHIIPIYQGGSDAIENIQPICRSCNAAKGPDRQDHRPPDWRKRLDECLAKRLGQSEETPTLYSIVNKQEEKILNFGKMGGGKKKWPYHGCVSKRRGTIWLQSGSSDFAAYADDYRAKNKIDPPIDDNGGYWFCIRGEGAA